MKKVLVVEDDEDGLDDANMVPAGNRILAACLGTLLLYARIFDATRPRGRESMWTDHPEVEEEESLTMVRLPPSLACSAVSKSVAE